MAVPVIDDASYQSAVAESERPVVMDFFATWCGPCRMLDPVVKELAEQYTGKVDFVKVDIDQARQVAENFAVTSVPTLVLVRGGQEVDRLVGARPKPALESWIQSQIAS
ncbi:MAG: thioredoxin [Planctomycetota bacterium]|nr:MAG: thioredoxin [Planctomycetota bacterium]